MTTYEHAMLGVTGTLAAGLHRRYGWQIVALGGLAATLPDWDGLSFFLGPRLFDKIHRTWGHNLVVATLVGAAVAASEYRFRLMDRIAGWARRRIRWLSIPETSASSVQTRTGELGVWVVTGMLASLSHLVVDLVYSGHEILSDWGLKLLWPFWDREWAYPMVPWGEPGTTLIFVGGMFAMVRWPTRLQRVAALTLVGVLAYIAVRGVVGL